MRNKANLNFVDKFEKCLIVLNCLGGPVDSGDQLTGGSVDWGGPVDWGIEFQIGCWMKLLSGQKERIDKMF